MERNHCTALPNHWKLTQKINKHCLQHDIDYVEQVKPKWLADYDFYKGLRQDCYFITAFIIASLASIGGIWFWYRRKFKNMLG